MSLQGIIIGISAFILIGIFHPIVIKVEYHFGAACWPVFLLIGTILGILSVFVQEDIVSALLAITAFSCLWSIIELKEQKKRVERGWFPKNPNRKEK